MAKLKKTQELMLEEKLEQALVPESEWPYVVPENWVWTRLEAGIDLYRGVSYKKDDICEQHDEAILVLRGGNINEDGTLNLFCSDNVYVPRKLVSSAQLIEYGDVIIVSSTGSTKVIGRVGISDSTYDAVAFGAFLTLARPNSIIYKKYTGLFFLSQQYRNEMRKLAKGVNINNIKNEYITGMRFPIPPLPEQQRIVARIESLFTKLDHARELVQSALDSFETRKAAILHQAFTGELTEKWRAGHGVRLEDWEDKQLESIATIISGFAFKSADFSADNEIPCIKITNVGVGYFENSEENDFLPQSFIESYKKFIVNKNDIVIALTRSFINAGLKVCIYPEEQSALLNQRVGIIRYNEKNYIYYYLQTNIILEYVKEKSKTTNQPNLSIKDLESMAIPVPTIPEQQEIVRILDSLLKKEQAAKDKLEPLLDQIDLMKKSILAHAFRGELGTNDPREESAVELLKEVLV